MAPRKSKKVSKGAHNDAKATQKQRVSRSEKNPTGRIEERNTTADEQIEDANARKNVFAIKDPVKKKEVPPKTHMRGRNGKKVSIRPSLVGDMRAVGSFVAGGRGDGGLSWRRGEDDASLLSVREKAAAADDENTSISDDDRGPRPSMTAPVRPGAELTHFAGYTPEKDKLAISDNDSLFGIGSEDESPPAPTTASKLKADRDAKADKRSKALSGTHFPETDDLVISDNDSLFGIGSEDESPPPPTTASKLKADGAVKAAKRSKALLGPVDSKVPKPRGEAVAKVTKPAHKPATKPANNSQFTGWAASLLGSGPGAKKN